MNTALTIVGFVAIMVPVLWFWSKVLGLALGWLDAKLRGRKLA